MFKENSELSKYWHTVAGVIMTLYICKWQYHLSRKVSCTQFVKMIVLPCASYWAYRGREISSTHSEFDYIQTWVVSRLYSQIKTAVCQYPSARERGCAGAILDVIVGPCRETSSSRPTHNLPQLLSTHDPDSVMSVRLNVSIFLHL